ncbi:MAG: HDOD domain-containing protein [Planctomycetaceae bacterium]|nr:HDOD domain-containing protein [Planctomycetaceae bacterium]
MTLAAATPVYPDAIQQIVARAGALYSLPAVAVEVLRLTESPRVDVQALKQCIERDPALTVKILRVVNSSLFGLPREVSDLNQALALLGIKPLKLLALGFSLPESLFLSVARDQLDWYWKTSLVRAVAAREISEQLFQKPGDDAFLAGLLLDIGVLVLLGELRQPYAAVLSEAIASQADLAVLEQESLGFDHRQLTAGLLQHWNLPPLLTAAIGAPHDTRYWAHNKADHAHLVRVLHLGELFAQLIGQRRLSVLPDLLDAGDAYCQLDKSRLHDLIATLEPKVRQLANVLSLQIAGGEDYTQIIVQAHAKMSQVAESVAAPLSRGIANDAASPIEQESHEAQALILAKQLRASFELFYRSGLSGEVDVDQALPRVPNSNSEAPAPVLASPFHAMTAAASAASDLETRLTLEVGRCRSLRRPIGLAAIEAQSTELLDSTQTEVLERLMTRACNRAEGVTTIEQLGPRRRLLLFPGRDRHEAVAAARHVVDEIRSSLEPYCRSEQLPAVAVGAGVACAAAPAKNFRPVSLLETADRCLTAALRSGGVKSLEVS